MSKVQCTLESQRMNAEKKIARHCSVESTDVPCYGYGDVNTQHRGTSEIAQYKH